jgi:ribosomal 50S subunit-recycling heat shock protein
MRVDKFLKVSRVIKRRTLAKEVCDAGRVSLNGRVAKAGSEVKEGDTLVINFGRRLLTIRILMIKQTVRAHEAAEMYEVLADEIREQAELPHLEDDPE